MDIDKIERNPIDTIAFEDLNIVLIYDFYDVPLTGFCIYKKQIAYFEIEDDFFAKAKKNYLMYGIYKIPLGMRIEVWWNVFLEKCDEFYHKIKKYIKGE